MVDFREGKEPCWIILDCSKYVYTKCPAYLNQELPCWETAYTHCEIMTGIKRECRFCKVFKLYHTPGLNPELPFPEPSLK